MRPRELFGVGVRILAVWFWTQAAFWGYWGAVKSFAPVYGNPTIPQQQYLGYAIFYALLGVILMLGARVLAWVAYGDAPRPGPNVERESDTSGPSNS